jgi:hypothetical protein
LREVSFTALYVADISHPRHPNCWHLEDCSLGEVVRKFDLRSSSRKRQITVGDMSIA